jgi:hypothetical protein
MKKVKYLFLLVSMLMLANIPLNAQPRPITDNSYVRNYNIGVQYFAAKSIN